MHTPRLPRAARIALPVCGLLAMLAQSAFAQQLEVPRLDQGFEVTAVPNATGQERQRQPDLYMLEVDFKPIRLRRVDITNPKTGRTESQAVYYLVYRLRNPLLAEGQSDDELRPQNSLDQPYTNPRFIPEATLLAFRGAEETDAPDQALLDAVLPEAVATISRTERRRNTPEIRDAIEIIQPLPEPAEDFDPIYGIATWTGVDEQTDYATVVLRGFTNAYERRQTDSGEELYRKALVLKFRRRGDEFDPDQREFEFDGEPEWRYLPE